jgi:hypothetical protein
MLIFLLWAPLSDGSKTTIAVSPTCYTASCRALGFRLSSGIHISPIRDVLAILLFRFERAPSGSGSHILSSDLVHLLPSSYQDRRRDYRVHHGSFAPALRTTTAGLSRPENIGIFRSPSPEGELDMIAEIHDARGHDSWAQRHLRMSPGWSASPPTTSTSRCRRRHDPMGTTDNTNRGCRRSTSSHFPIPRPASAVLTFFLPPKTNLAILLLKTPVFHN